MNATAKIRCSTCEQEKPAADFPASILARGRKRCTDCNNAYQREWSRKNKDRTKKAQEKWKASKTVVELREIRSAARQRARESGATVGYTIKYKYGISKREYDAMLLAQGGKCAICASSAPDGKRLYVDHDHATGMVRGLLCQKCNSGIGMFKDNAATMRAAIEYIERGGSWQTSAEAA